MEKVRRRGSTRTSSWMNKMIKQEARTRTDKAVFSRPITIYAAETRTDPCKTKQLLGTKEKKIRRKITGKTDG